METNQKLAVIIAAFAQLIAKRSCCVPLQFVTPFATAMEALQVPILGGMYDSDNQLKYFYLD